jgi:hypothetical protein
VIVTKIVAHLDVSSLAARYKCADEGMAKSHFHALWLLASGRSVGEVAAVLSFSTRWVSALVKRYNEGGPDRLGDQRARNGNAPTILRPEALAALKARLKSVPDDGGLWSGPKVARWLARFHAVRSVHDQRGFDALVAVGYSIQRPRPRHPESAGEAELAAFKKNSTTPSPANARRIPRRRSKSGRRTSIASA